MGYQKVPTTTLYLYETQPVGSITGTVELFAVYTGKPFDVWQLTRERGGVTTEEYVQYYRAPVEAVQDGGVLAHAWYLRNPHKFKIPFSLRERPPQSYMAMPKYAADAIAYCAE